MVRLKVERILKRVRFFYLLILHTPYKVTATHFHGQGIFLDGSLEPLNIIESSTDLGFRAALFNFEVISSYVNPNCKLLIANPT